MSEAHRLRKFRQNSECGVSQAQRENGKSFTLMNKNVTEWDWISQMGITKLESIFSCALHGVGLGCVHRAPPVPWGVPWKCTHWVDEGLPIRAAARFFFPETKLFSNLINSIPLVSPRNKEGSNPFQFEWAWRRQAELRLIAYSSLL